MTTQTTVLARMRKLLAHLFRVIMLDRPEYRGPNGELADDDETARRTLPPWLWPEPPR